MRYVLAVKHPIYGSQGAYTAYQFAQALLQRNHQINQIFFLQAGVSNANEYVNPANDEFDLQQAWIELSQRHQIPLHLCLSASQRRGVVDYHSSKNELQQNLAAGFVLAGLGEFNQALLEADRLVSL